MWTYTGGTVHQRVHTRDSQKKSRQIKTYFNQLEILTMCNNMNNVNSTAVHKYTSFNFNFKLSSYLKEPSYTEWWWSDKSADEL